MSNIFPTFVLSLQDMVTGMGTRFVSQRESILQPTLYLYIKNSPMFDFLFGIVIGMELLYFLQQLIQYREEIKRVKKIRRDNGWGK